MSYKVCVGLDSGFRDFKGKSQSGQVLIASSVSLAPPKRVAKLLDDGKELVVDTYLIDGKTYTVGEDVEDPLDTRHDGFHSSPEALALAMHALYRLVPANAEVLLVTGVPLNRYYDSTGNRRANLSEIGAALRRKVERQDGRTLPVIGDQIHVISQAVAANFDLVVRIGPDGTPFKDEVSANRTRAILDVGGRTTDLAVVKGNIVDMPKSGTLDAGVLDAVNDVRLVIEDQLGPVPLTRMIIDRALRSGEAEVGVMNVDVHEALAGAKQRLLERIRGFMDGKIGRHWPFIEEVVLVGGGVDFLPRQELDHLIEQRNPKIRVVRPANPQFANARGLYAYAKVVAYDAQKKAKAVDESVRLVV